MADVRPKIVILAAHSRATEELAELLSDRCDVVFSEGLGPAEADAVFVIQPADPGKLGPNGLGDHERDTLLDSLPEAICLVTAEGKQLWGNPAFDGLPRDIQKRSTAAAAKAAASFRGRRVETPGMPEPLRSELAHEDGRIFELLCSPMKTAEASRLGDRALGVVRDITEASRVREKLRAIDEAGSALIRLDPEAIRELNSAERLRLVEDRIIRAAHDLLGCDFFGIRMLDRASGRLTMAISSGFPDEAVNLELYQEEENNGIIGYVAATGKPYICRDAQHDPRFMPGAAGARSSLTVPLKIENRIIGVLDIESQEPNAYDHDDLRFAEMFARYIAIALHMLDLLVVERSSTGQTLSTRFEGEIDDPLCDIVAEVETLAGETTDPEARRHLERIKADVQSVRDRAHAVAAGPNTLLGLDKISGPDQRDPVLAGKRVLIADDQPQIRGMIEDVLRRRGCVVVACGSGQQAINELEVSAAEGHLPFDLVISDISMPDRNGYEVFEVARGVVAERAIILMTGFGYDPHHSIVRASQLGMRNVLYKPFQAQRLIDEAHKAVGPPV
jgi:CheY-like chemotaxis protein